MDELAIILVDGLVFASWLFLVGVGMTLIFGVLRILNIAHGSLYALGAYMAATLIIPYFDRNLWAYGSYVVLVFAALLVGATVGPALERGVLRWMYGRDEVLQLLTTYSVFLILEDVMKLVWGTDPYNAYQPFSVLGEFSLGGIRYPNYFLLLMGMAVIAGVGLSLFINRTRFGRLVLAATYDPEISTALGIHLPRVYVVAFALGSVLAALAGALTAPMIAPVPGIAVEIIVLGFATVAIGGLGSLPGAAIGGLLVGLARAAAVHLLPELELFVIYMVMAAVLLFRPYGLFARQEVRRI